MKNVKFYLLTLLIIVGLFSCQKEIETNPDNQGRANDDIEPQGMIVLGKKLENPYSLKNMKKAYENLKNSGQLKSGSVEDFEITATHLYVRFLPEDTNDLNKLWADKSIELFDFPH